MSSVTTVRPPTNPSRTRKPAPPLEVTGRIITGSGQGVADLFGGCAILEVETALRREAYWCTLHVSPDGHIAGIRLQKFGAGTIYDLPADLSECECGDHQYRGRECKHMLALRLALANVAKDNPPPSRPHRRVERDAVAAPDQE